MPRFLSVPPPRALVVPGVVVSGCAKNAGSSTAILPPSTVNYNWYPFGNYSVNLDNWLPFGGTQSIWWNDQTCWGVDVTGANSEQGAIGCYPNASRGWSNNDNLMQVRSTSGWLPGGGGNPNWTTLSGMGIQVSALTKCKVKWNIGLTPTTPNVGNAFSRWDALIDIYYHTVANPPSSAWYPQVDLQIMQMIMDQPLTGQGATTSGFWALVISGSNYCLKTFNGIQYVVIIDASHFNQAGGHTITMFPTPTMFTDPARPNPLLWGQNNCIHDVGAITAWLASSNPLDDFGAAIHYAGGTVVTTPVIDPSWYLTVVNAGFEIDFAATPDASFKTSDFWVSMQSEPDGDPIVQFPVSIASGGRYLQDAAGVPFPLTNDSGWLVSAECAMSQAQQYFDDRAARGYTASLVMALLPQAFSTHTPYYADATGNVPFTGTVAGGYLDMSTPSEPYWAHLDAVINYAKSKGMVVFLFPAYLGFGGGWQGWYATVNANSQAQRQAYGTFLGNRYASSKFGNVIFIWGGDYHPPSLGIVDDMASRVLLADPTAMQGAHTDSTDTSTYSVYGAYSWCNINSVYTETTDIATKLHTAWGQKAIPTFNLDNVYEYTTAPPQDTQQFREPQWISYLWGVAGSCHGNESVWPMGGTGNFPVYGTWTTALGSPGQPEPMAKNLLSTYPWQKLVPDYTGSFVTSGSGSNAWGAKASDNTFALVYVDSGSATVALSQLTGYGTHVNAYWYDPSSSTPAYRTITGSPFNASGTHSFTVPGNNSQGDTDWVLVLKSAP